MKPTMGINHVEENPCLRLEAIVAMNNPYNIKKIPVPCINLAPKIAKNDVIESTRNYMI